MEPGDAPVAVGYETGEYDVGNAGVFAPEVFYFAAVTEYLCGDVYVVHSDMGFVVGNKNPGCRCGGREDRIEKSDNTK